MASTRRRTDSAATIRNWPASARPRERLIGLGGPALSDIELLGCLLGRGVAGASVLAVAEALLARFGTLRALASASPEQLAAVRGVGPAKAAQLKAAGELARRLLAPDDQPSPPLLDSPEAAAAVLWPWVADAQAEHVLAALLDTRRRLLRVTRVAIGSLSASLVHPRELIQETGFSKRQPIL